MRNALVRLILSLLFLSPLLARAEPASDAYAAQKAAAEKAWSDAKTASTAGPAEIALASEAILHLPAGKVYVPQPQAASLLRAMGNPGNYASLQGLIFPREQGANWFAILSYESSGYIKDDEAKDWNADDMLKSFREGTEAANVEREKMGIPGMEIIGWAQKPSYEAATHRLVWAMSSRSKNAPAGAVQGVNYNTYALGREGYLSLNLVTDLPDLPADKTEVEGLLADIEFKPGKRYADFNASTDHIAEYGLAALVLGVGAKKLGLLALGFAFLAKFAKIIALTVLGFGGALSRWWKTKRAGRRAPLPLPAPDSRGEIIDLPHEKGPGEV